MFIPPNKSKDIFNPILKVLAKLVHSACAGKVALTWLLNWFKICCFNFTSSSFALVARGGWKKKEHSEVLLDEMQG